MQGLNDFLVFGGVTLAYFSSGGLMNCSGGLGRRRAGDGGEHGHAALPRAGGGRADLAGDASR